MSKSQVNKNRRMGALVAYTTLACSVVSLGLYVYRQQQKKNGADGNRADQNNGVNNGRGSTNTGRDRNTRTSPNGSAEAQSSSLSRLGSKIAKTVKRNRRVMTTFVWNPSPDPTTPNYGFVEGAIPLLFHLAENYNLHLILLCPSAQTQKQSTHGKERELSVQELEQIKQERQMWQERERDQILGMLRNAGLVDTGKRGPKLFDPRQLLICETEEGISHVVRHLESHIHVEAKQSVVELVQGVIPRVIFVQKKVSGSRRSSRAHSRTSSIAREPSEEENGGTESIMTRSHVRVRQASMSRSGSSSGSSGAEDSYGRAPVMNGDSSSRAVTDGAADSGMGDSFVEVIKGSPSVAAVEPLVSGYVTQAGKKGYVEVTDSVVKSSCNPEYKQK
ncbi:hypothetical protein BGW38_010779 [Lunasporangiospora selenospora]|uniref:Uncharacterized protein n=1 Tax=Lunasporangiospora selenospora TaxID=979761 RepID=A0A9P6G2L1_9FUNG|nr:hypothetical protein BGW38_010779 [Lunasporangiospora selenospora]